MDIQGVGVDFDSLKKQEMIDCFQIRLGRITTATIKARMCFCLSGRWSEIQANRFAGGRWLWKSNSPIFSDDRFII